MDPILAELALVTGAGLAFSYAKRTALRQGLAHMLQHAGSTVLAWAGMLAAAEDADPAHAPDPRTLAEQYIVTIGEQRLLTHTAWAQILNDMPDRYPHTLIVGPTGSGKTTFTQALLATRPGRVTVLTPKPDAADWPGVPIITIDDDGTFGSLSRAFSALDQELRTRLVAAKHRQPITETLTIVCDDWPVLAAECAPASTIFKLVGRLGRSLRVRMVVLSQSARVKSLGLEGEGDTAQNFAQVVLSRGHRAVLESDGHSMPLDTRAVPTVARQPSNPARWWFPPEPVPTGTFLADMRMPAEPVPAGTHPVPADTNAVLAGSRSADGEAEKIRTLAQQGWSRNQIAGELGGRRADALERIRAVLG